jgi:hypothetical protein
VNGKDATADGIKALVQIGRLGIHAHSSTNIGQFDPQTDCQHGGNVNVDLGDIGISGSRSRNGFGDPFLSPLVLGFSFGDPTEVSGNGNGWMDVMSCERCVKARQHKTKIHRVQVCPVLTLAIGRSIVKLPI